MTSNVTIIIVNWRLKEATASCLGALETSDQAHHVLVVDNGSADGSVAYLKDRFPSVEVLPLAQNIGFGPACNLALAKALKDPDCEFVFLLNNDTQVHPQALSHLLKAAKVHPEAGILGPKIYYADRPGVIWYAGARRRRAVLAATETGRGQVDQGQFERRREVDYVFGTAMFVRRSVFEQIGFFDEQYFLYLEDLDFCLRAQNSGFSLLYIPQARVLHKGSASTLGEPSLRRYHLIKSTTTFLKNYINLANLFPILAFWSAVYLRALFQDLIRRDLGVIQADWKGLVDGLWASKSSDDLTKRSVLPNLSKMIRRT